MSLIASYHLLLEPSTAFQSQLSNTGWGQHVTCFSPPLPSKQFSLQSSCFVKQEPFPAPALQVVMQQRKVRPPGSPMEPGCAGRRKQSVLSTLPYVGAHCAKPGNTDGYQLQFPGPPIVVIMPMGCVGTSPLFVSSSQW